MKKIGNHGLETSAEKNHMWAESLAEDVLEKMKQNIWLI